MNADERSAARRRIDLVAHALECDRVGCRRCLRALTLDTLRLVAIDSRKALDALEVTRAEAGEMMRGRATSRD
jgi:hypothetical protein